MNRALSITHSKIDISFGITSRNGPATEKEKEREGERERAKKFTAAKSKLWLARIRQDRAAYLFNGFFFHIYTQGKGEKLQVKKISMADLIDLQLDNRVF